MKKIVFIFICILTCSLGYSQTELSGNVKDASGVPIIGANVIIEGSSSGATTDFDGNFQFTTSAIGDKNLRISYLGFTSYVEKVSLAGAPIILEVTLQEGGSQLDEVVLTASSTFRSQKQAPLSISSVKLKEITRLSASSQADILRKVPGITPEGGGGETAANIFIRGLPSPGQFGFTPLQHDGLPLISSFGLNSSAHDVYARNDMGFKGVEFVRGGAASLYGAGSTAGVINYISKTGDTDPGNTVNLEWADGGRIKTDFYSGGRLGGKDSDTYYAFSGWLRKDDGPYETGSVTRGFQFRGNIKKKFERGDLKLYMQFINDRSQFFLPLSLAPNGDYLPGNDGEPVRNLLAGSLAGTSFRTAGGNYDSPIDDGVYTKGGYAMLEFNYDLTDQVSFESKFKYADYQHSFALYVPGNGTFANPTPISEYVDIIAPGNQGFSASFQGGLGEISPTTLVNDNLNIDRIRPMNDISGEGAISYRSDNGHHNFKLGTYMSRTEVVDDNFQYRALTEFNNDPKLINLSYTDADGNNVVFSEGGIYNRIGQTANKFLTQNRTAFYLTDEMIFDRWRLDVGVRWEETSAEFRNGNIVSSQVYDNPELTPELANVRFKDGSFITATYEDSDFAISLAGLYELTDATNIYANFSRGFFFPQVRNLGPSPGEDRPFYQALNLTQFEAGSKFGNKVFSGSVAGFYTTLTNNIDIETANVNNQLVIAFREETDSRTFGVEANYDLQLTKGLSLIGSFTYQDHEITKATREDLINGGITSSIEGNEIRRQPNVLGSAGLFYDDNRFDANFGFSHTGKKWDNSENTRELPSITIGRMGTGYTFKALDAYNIRLGASVFNLFNTNNVTANNPRTTNGVINPNFGFGRPILPRRFFVTATFNF